MVYYSLIGAFQRCLLLYSKNGFVLQDNSYSKNREDYRGRVWPDTV